MRYSPALDGIRAIAILMVLVAHGGIAPSFTGGFFGVDVFFVLSGYLITRLLVEERQRTGRIALADFYIRRLRRLYPALLTMLAVLVATAPWVFPNVGLAKMTQDAIVSALYLVDYSRELDMKVNSALGHLWSLSIEEHFYLVWPLILIGVTRLPRRVAMQALIGLFVAATLYRVHSSFFWASGDQMYFRFDLHASGLALGGLLGYWKPRIAPAWGWVGLAGIVACAFHFDRDLSPAIYDYGFTLAEISSALLIAAPPAILGALSWLGRMSYGLYLWHIPPMIWIVQQGGNESDRFILGGLFGLAMAVLSYYTVEAYFRRSRNKPALNPAVEPVDFVPGARPTAD